MAKRTTADILTQALIDWGVEVVFGIPGDGINGLMESLRKRQDEIRFIQTRHEEAAALMACGYAKFTGKLGVCVATSGPGGIHLLNGLYDAKLDGQPVLAITGLQFHDLIDTHTQQDVALDKLYMDVARYNTRVMGPAHMRNVADLACRTALYERTVAHITIPVDVQDLTLDDAESSKRNILGHTSTAGARTAEKPAEQDLKVAAEILNDGRKVAILAGAGALKAGDLLEQTAARLKAPIVKALLGKAAVPDDSPYTTGTIGLLGTTASQEALEQCDTLLMVGTSFPYIEFLPRPGQAHGVQIDLDPRRIGLRFPVDVGLVGDSGTCLAALLPLLTQKQDDSFLAAAQKSMQSWWQLMEERGTRPDKPMKPQVVAWELGHRIHDDAIVCGDSGTIATWYARQMRVRRGQMYSLSGTLATMANGLPYAIAAQVAYPERQVVALVGDGGFSMLMADFVTAVKYRLPVKIFVIKNGTLGQIKWEQMVFLGNPEYAVDLQPMDFAQIARAMGGHGISVDDPAECGEAVQAALDHSGPVVVECVVDPFEPPMPANVTLDQAKKFAESLLRGQPYRGKIALTVLENRVREII